MADVIHNVPQEILMKYFETLPLKPAINFASSSKWLQQLLCNRIEKKEEEYVLAMLLHIIKSLKAFYNDMVSRDRTNNMLSFMLRRLIHTTAVYNTINDADLNFALSTKFNDEYNNTFMYVNEELEMNIKEFNTYMENAQFEYRGFNIVGLPLHERQRLDAFKRVIENRYFNEPFKLQTYLAFDNNVFMEIIIDNDFVEFDFHYRRPEDGQWVFIDQAINAASISLEHAREINRMLCFHHQNNEAVREIVTIMFMLFNKTVKGCVVKGAEQTNVSVWNNMYEDNIVLAETINCHMSDYGIDDILHEITKTAIHGEDFARVH